VTKRIDTRTPNSVASTPATVENCQGDRNNRPGSEDRTPSQVDTLRAGEAAVQRGLVSGQVAR
jgi:hypothetical protein